MIKCSNDTISAFLPCRSQVRTSCQYRVSHPLQKDASAQPIRSSLFERASRVRDLARHSGQQVTLEFIVDTAVSVFIKGFVRDRQPDRQTPASDHTPAEPELASPDDRVDITIDRRVAERASMTRDFADLRFGDIVSQLTPHPLELEPLIDRAMQVFLKGVDEGILEAWPE